MTGSAGNLISKKHGSAVLGALLRHSFQDAAHLSYFIGLACTRLAHAVARLPAAAYSSCRGEAASSSCRGEAACSCLQAPAAPAVAKLPAAPAAAPRTVPLLPKR